MVDETTTWWSPSSPHSLSRLFTLLDILLEFDNSTFGLWGFDFWVWVFGLCLHSRLARARSAKIELPKFKSSDVDSDTEVTEHRPRSLNMNVVVELLPSFPSFLASKSRSWLLRKLDFRLWTDDGPQTHFASKTCKTPKGKLTVSRVEENSFFSNGCSKVIWDNDLCSGGLRKKIVFMGWGKLGGGQL